jgi:hypothetical protein
MVKSYQHITMLVLAPNLILSEVEIFKEFQEGVALHHRCRGTS